MARGVDSRGNDARIVDMRRWTMRNHPSAGGSGNKPPKTPKTKTGGSGEPADDGDPASFNKAMGYMADRLFPSAPKDPIEKRPDYKGKPNKIEDLNVWKEAKKRGYFE